MRSHEVNKQRTMTRNASTLEDAVSSGQRTVQSPELEVHSSQSILDVTRRRLKGDAEACNAIGAYVEAMTEAHADMQYAFAVGLPRWREEP